MEVRIAIPDDPRERGRGGRVVPGLRELLALAEEREGDLRIERAGGRGHGGHLCGGYRIGPVRAHPGHRERPTGGPTVRHRYDAPVNEATPLPGAPATPPSPATPSGGRIVALIPAYREAPRIAAVIAGARAHLPVVVVDDGSDDGTAEVAAGAGATVVRQVPNQGKGAALRAGFRHALAAGVEAVVTLDADGQHDPAEIPAFLGAWGAGEPALVIGRRDFRAMPLARRIANGSARRLFSRAVGTDVPDNQSGYRLISRPLMERLLASGETGFTFEVEMITTAVRDGLPIAWVPIRTIYAGAPSHIRPVEHVVSFLRITRTARRAVRGGRPPGGTAG